MRLLDDNCYAACGFTPESRVLVALSGGADSTALFIELTRWYDEGKLLLLAAAHMHHGIRGESADSDERFCATLCEQYGLPFFVTHANIPQIAAQEGLSVEQAARDTRYRFLNHVAQKNDYDKIAVAHHMSDQAETMLQHLIRGCGLTGLCGMRPVNGNIVRPLLSRSKDDILAFLKEIGRPYCEDESNATDCTQRNRLRHTLFPLLIAENPKAIENMAKCAERLQGDEEILDFSTALALLFSDGNRALIARMPSALRNRAILQLLAKAGVRDVTANAVERTDALLQAQSGSYIELPNGVFATVAGEALVFSNSPPITPRQYTIPIAAGESAITPQGSVRLTKTDSAAFPPPKSVLYLNADAARGDFYLRLPKRGDRFAPFGMKTGSKLLSDYFTDKKVYGDDRKMPVLCDEGGIAAICGFTIDERFRVGADDTKLLMLTFDTKTR